MSDKSADDDTMTTDEFEAALGELLAAAQHNNIDPRGSWMFRADGAGENWEVMIYEVE